MENLIERLVKISEDYNYPLESVMKTHKEKSKEMMYRIIQNKSLTRDERYDQLTERVDNYSMQDLTAVNVMERYCRMKHGYELFNQK